jgi:Ca2+/Na+ antiporter
VSYAVFSLVSVAVVDHASFRLILLLLARFVCVNCFLSMNLSSFLLPGCRLLLLLCCLVYVVYLIVMFALRRQRKTPYRVNKDILIKLYFL